MSLQLSFIGFGEAAQAFAPAIVSRGIRPRSFDIKLEHSENRHEFANSMMRQNVDPQHNHSEAIIGAELILSLVTADQALMAARQVTAGMPDQTLYCDMNSVAPDTKHAACEAIEKAGGRYADVAIMAPVHPAKENVPLLVSGPNAEAARAALDTSGFTNICVVGDQVGQASAIKMIRSIMVKGTEALTAEMMLAAREAGVEEEVLASLGEGWNEKAAYNLERMETHGLRRAAEMEEVAKTLESLDIEPVMTRGTIIRQRAMAKGGANQ